MMYRSNLGWAYFRIGNVSLYILCLRKKTMKILTFILLWTWEKFRGELDRKDEKQAQSSHSVNREAGATGAAAEAGKGSRGGTRCDCPGNWGRRYQASLVMKREHTEGSRAWAWPRLCFNTTTLAALWRMIVVNQNNAKIPVRILL